MARESARSMDQSSFWTVGAARAPGVVGFSVLSLAFPPTLSRVSPDPAHEGGKRRRRKRYEGHQVEGIQVTDHRGLPQDLV